MIERILPPYVVVRSTRQDMTDLELFAEEEAIMRRAVAARRAEFGTVRTCARRALATLGYEPAPILRDERGAPRWPADVVGSMTHCVGYRAAAVAPTSRVSALGIDAEPHEPLPDGVASRIARPEELDRLERLRREVPEVCWDRLLFSAKESVYKTWYPAVGLWLDFSDASVTFDKAGTFFARVLPDDSPVSGYHGRWIVTDGLIGTAVLMRTSTAAVTARA